MTAGPASSTLATWRGRRILGLLCAVAFLDFTDASITNVALPAEGEAQPEPSHAEVVATAEAAGQPLGTIIQGVVQQLAQETL